MTRKNNHGGAREGSGRHPKHGEPTQFIGLRVPVSLLKRIDAIGNRSETIITRLKQSFTE